VAILPAACDGVGPQTVARDRFDYAGAIGDSWKSQMLLNLVKIRYGDNPVFLDIGQVVAGYSLQRSVAASGSFFTFNQSAPLQAVTGVLGGAAGMSYTDSPTIIYTPLSGEKFSRAIMSPVPLRSILQVLQSGFPVDVIFRLGVQSINGVDNSRTSGGANRFHTAEPEFYDLLEQLGQIQATGDIGFRHVTQGDMLTLEFRKSSSADTQRAIEKTKRILKLDPAENEFKVVLTAVPKSNREIAIVSRSIYEILLYISAGISVPDIHVQQHRVNATPQETFGGNTNIASLVQIHDSSERPADAFAAIPYRNYWFFIDDRDTRSKKIFSFIMLLFTFVEPATPPVSTTLTIPANR